MRKTIVTLFAASILPAISAPQVAGAAEIQIVSAGPVVEVTTSQVVQSAPDEAAISAGVTTRARTAVAAMRDNATKMDAVIARLRSLGIARELIQTSGVTLNPAYNYPNNQPPEFIGYDVTNQVSVTLKRLDNIGQTLDALVEAGANNINGPNFRREDDSDARQAAREIAFEEARKQALAYARLAGFSGVKLLEIDETTVQQGVYDIQLTAKSVRDAAPAVSTPVEPGRVATTVQVLAKYELTR